MSTFNDLKDNLTKNNELKLKTFTAEKLLSLGRVAMALGETVSNEDLEAVDYSVSKYNPEPTTAERVVASRYEIGNILANMNESTREEVMSVIADEKKKAEEAIASGKAGVLDPYTVNCADDLIEFSKAAKENPNLEYVEFAKYVATVNEKTDKGEAFERETN